MCQLDKAGLVDLAVLHLSQAMCVEHGGRRRFRVDGGGPSARGANNGGERVVVAQRFEVEPSAKVEVLKSICVSQWSIPMEHEACFENYRVGNREAVIDVTKVNQQWSTVVPYEDVFSVQVTMRDRTLHRDDDLLDLR